MKTLTVYLSNNTISLGSQVFGYVFIDPLTHQSTSYPLSVNGGGVGTNDFAVTSSYPTTAYDGAFFPWGFNLNNQTYLTVLSNIKGDYTINFVATGIQTNPMRMVYNFGDGSQSKSVIQPLTLNSINFANINSYIYGDNFLSPKNQIISHNYYALTGSNSYNVSITAINPDLTFHFFNFRFTQYPNSLYDFSSVHALDAVLQTNTLNSINFIEIGDNNIVTPLVLNTNNTLKYPVPYLSTAY